jgi:hypothetical protein
MFSPNFDIVDTEWFNYSHQPRFFAVERRASSGQTVMATNLTHAPCLGDVTLACYTVRVAPSVRTVP